MRYFVVLTMALACGLIGEPGYADGKNSLRLHYAKSSETDMVTAFAGDFSASRESNYNIGASWGRQLSETLFGLPISTTANLGTQYFDERGHQDDAYGVTAYVKAHYSWKLPLTDKRIRLGLGEGLSYVSRIPMSEQRDFARKGGAESEKLLNYLEWTIDLPLHQFASFQPLMGGQIEEAYVGFIVWHRSSVFGLLSETGGGVNFMGFAFEARY